MKFHLFFLILFTVCPLLKAQTLSKTQSMEDMVHLKKSIKIYNPALEVYNPGFEQDSDQLLNKPLPEMVSLLEHFINLSELCALSNEGHFNLGNWEDPVHAGFLDNSYRYMPLSVKILEDKLLVWLDLSVEQELDQGDEIISINGKSTREILDLFLEKYPADGTIETYVWRTLELGFNWMYFLYVEQPEKFELVVKRNTGEETTMLINALKRDLQFGNYAKYYPERAEKSQNPDSTFHILEHRDQYTYLKLPSFDRSAMEAHDIKSGKFYREIFRELSDQQVNTLVIDLRGNTGGRYEMADDMVPYILQDDRSDAFLKKSISWEGRERTYKLPSRSKYLFNGQIFVLVNGRTYSSGSTLARYLKEYGKAVIIGEETGSRYEGYAAGSRQTITLHHSGLKIGIPRYHIIYPKSQVQTTTNRGVLPDHPIAYNSEALMKETDLLLEKVLQLLQNKADTTPTNDPQKK